MRLRWPFWSPAARGRSGATEALAHAERKAAATKDPDEKLVLLTGIGIQLLPHDPQRGKALLSEARQIALHSNKASPTARVYAIAQRALAFSALDRRNAPSTLAQAVREAEGVYAPRGSREVVLDSSPIVTVASLIQSASWQYGSLLATMAALDPDRALQVAKRLPDKERKSVLAEIAESIARSNLPRAARLLQTALQPPLVVIFPSWHWRNLCIAAASTQPRKAISLARSKLPSSPEHAQVLEAVVTALARKDRPAAEDVITQETDPVMRAWGWLALAHVSQGGQRDSAIRRAAETIGRAKLSESARSTAVTEWCVLAVMARPGAVAKKYLAAAEGAQHTPPLDYERGMMLAAACYVDPAKAMKIHRELLAKRRTGPNRRSVDAVLTFLNHLVARVDVRAAERTVTEAPDWARETFPAAVQMAYTAVQTVPLDGEDRARQLMRAAQRELAAQRKRVKAGAADYYDESSLPQAMEMVALGLAATGDASAALRLAGQIGDPGSAGQTYLAIARYVGQQPAARTDAYAALQSVASSTELLSRPYELAVPHSGARPAPPS